MNRSNHICFVHAPEVFYEQTQGARFVPLWAYTLAAHVPKDWKVSVFDATVADVTKIQDATLFAFSGINQDFYSIKKTQMYLKDKYPHAKFLLGGPIAWSYEKMGKLRDLEYFDHIFILDGEESLPDFLNRFRDLALSQAGEKVVRCRRFPMEKAKKICFDLLRVNTAQYYGGVVEVSRGCPFLCEFCDVRVLPNNNDSHNKEVGLIIEELDEYRKLGIRQIQFACDNFIGDLSWARKCVDAILEWNEETGTTLALFTWATVNLSRYPELMFKMRKAGFTTLFIGVESFNNHSLLETAKVQNRDDKGQMTEALRTIQSYGFIVVPGLILGFDSDGPQLFDDALKGVINTGLIAGYPNFLVALPGTPLYERMQRTDRLVMNDEAAAATSSDRPNAPRIESNIKYLLPSDFLIKGFMQFIRRFASAEIMYKRFRNHVSLLMKGRKLVPVSHGGYGSLPHYLGIQTTSLANLAMLFQRLLFLARPDRLWVILKAYALVLRYRYRYEGLKNHFSTWLFLWSSVLIRFGALREEDFQIHSIGDDYSYEKMWQDLEFQDDRILPNGRDADNVKVANQARITREALSGLKKSLQVTLRL